MLEGGFVVFVTPSHVYKSAVRERLRAVIWSDLLRFDNDRCVTHDEDLFGIDANSLLSMIAARMIYDAIMLRAALDP